MKSELLVDLSHEFRTPLTLVLGPLRDLQAGCCGELSADTYQQIDLARRSAERLQGIVDQILDAARLESGQLHLEVRHGDLTELLGDLAESFGGLAERSGRRLRFAPPASAIPLWFDPEQLHKVISNLLANALHYAPAGGEVELTVEVSEDGSLPAAGTVAVTVRDEGPGIAVKDQKHIFDRFYRAVHPGRRNDGGTGLGLPLARRLAELHGGSLTLASAPGKGSAFRVELRLGRDHFEPGQIVDDAPWRPLTVEAPPPRIVEFAEAKTPSPADCSADRTTILVVDDHQDIRAYVRGHLEPKYRVEEAADGAEALATARDLLPDLVISDVMMPEMDGFALCQALRDDPELDWIPVLLLTARATLDDKLEGLDGGADAYLTKPFDARELTARVDNLITSRRRLKQRFADGTRDGRPRLPLAPGVRPTPDDRLWLGRVLKTIETELVDDEFSVEILATELAVHRSRLYQRLKLLTGNTPQQLINRRRLERSAVLLQTQDVSISEAAYAVGFRSVAHFSHRFSERYGASPSAWRQGRWAVAG